MGLQLKGLARLVEADVAVGAKAQQLQVDAAHAVDDLVVLFAGARGVRVRAVGHVDGLRVDIHPVEEMGLHEVAVALLMGAAAGPGTRPD